MPTKHTTPTMQIRTPFGTHHEGANAKRDKDDLNEREWGEIERQSRQTARQHYTRQQELDRAQRALDEG